MKNNKRKVIKKLFIGGVLLSLFSCSNLLKLNSNLNKINDISQRYIVNIDFDDSIPEDIESSVILITMGSLSEAGIENYFFANEKEKLQFYSTNKLTHLFAFLDKNQDFTYQENEASSLISIDKKTNKIETIQLSHNNQATPDFLVNLPFSSYTKVSNLNLNIGTVTALDDPIFSPKNGKIGMWEPFAFLELGGFGVHMLTEYSEDKIPVLIVHGVDDTPRRFNKIISALDNSKYQAWVFYYPSASRLQNIAEALNLMMTSLHYQYKFNQLHVVAHSMGGLVSLSYINQCVATGNCSYLSSFTSISTPWKGYKAAESGVKYSPVVMPSWRDMDPNSEFIAGLFKSSFHEQLHYNLIFTFKNESSFQSESDDGVISLESQLPVKAQEIATVVRGFNETHTSILESENFLQYLQKVLKESEQ